MAKNWRIQFRCLTSRLTDQITPAGILLDLDGTVLPVDHRPSPRVMNAVAEASKRIPVAIASGREQDEVGHFARMFGLTTPQVAENGATLMDPITGRAISRHLIDRATIEPLVEEIAKSASGILVSDAGRLVRDPADIKDWQISIIMARFADEAEARKWADRYPPDVISACATNDNQGDWYLDCTAPGVDKAAGARDFANAVGAAPEEFLVIGDGSNDLPMFEVAGISVAMEGSTRELIEVATDVTADLANDGAALAIEKYVLG